MSSFKRRTPAQSIPLPPGTRPCAISPLIPLISTGIPSLDDVLGGGLPLSTSLLVLSPDTHSAWGQLVQKYFIAQGLKAGQAVCLIGDKHELEQVTEGCMWVPAGEDDSPLDGSAGSHGAETEDDEAQDTGGVKIAWRYQRMKRFSTTVPHSASRSAPDNFCAPFDLTCRISDSVIAHARDTGQLVTIEVPDDDDDESTLDFVLRKTAEVITEGGYSISPTTGNHRALRLSFPSLLARAAASSPVLLRLPLLVHDIRQQLRSSLSSALVTFPPHISAAISSRPNLANALTQFSDAALTLFSDPLNPLPSNHGVVHLHKLPALHSLVPPSDRLSVLRGLGEVHAGGGTSGGGGENNLAFKCKRRQFVIETLHLDVEGGVGERRTEARATTATVDTENLPSRPKRPEVHVVALHDNSERDAAAVPVGEAATSGDANSPRGKATRKKVAFRHDQPDLYDF